MWCKIPTTYIGNQQDNIDDIGSNHRLRLRNHVHDSSHIIVLPLLVASS